MRIDLNLPKGWKDITGKQLVVLSNVFLKRMKKPDFMIRCFLVFSGWKILKRRDFREDGKRQFWFKSEKQTFYIDSDLFHTLLSSLNFLTEKIELPAGNPQIKGYKSCNHKLYNVTLESFLEADNFFKAFSTTEKRVFLKKLFRVLYKKKRWIVFHRVSMSEKYAVFLWFSGVKNYLVNKYPYLFSSGAGNSDPEEEILSLLTSLNGGKPHDNERILKTHVHECFYELNLKIENAPKK